MPNPMKAVDLRILLEDEVEDQESVIFIAVIDGKEVKFSIAEDTDFTHGEEQASIRLFEIHGS